MLTNKDLYSIRGRTVLVTGAGGSIGSELCVQIAEAEPADLVMIDSSELNLYAINCTLADMGFAPRHPLILDVRDEKGLRFVFEKYKPAIVFHAAALKHVPLMENDHNLVEGVLTNVGGTMNVALACDEFRSEMVFISSDKAVNPSSVMGLTKRVAEIWLHGLSKSRSLSTMLQVRFGNVLGSSGSVVPLFQKQIANKGPVTVTHRDMSRYMMSIKQAVELVLYASEIHQEDGVGCGVYILDMGKPVMVYELAESMIEQAGYRPHKDIQIEIIGIRPGEKLFEELHYSWETAKPTRVEGISVSTSEMDTNELAVIMRLMRAAKDRRYTDVKNTLVEIVPEYTGAGVWA